MKKLKLSIVYYLNALPLSWGFMRGSQQKVFDLDFSPPSLCSDQLADGRVDIGLIPVIEYLRIPDLKVVPGLSLAAKQAVKSVLLFSKVTPAEINTVAVDNSSRTSVTLLKILLRERYLIDPSFFDHGPDLQVMLQDCDAALLIGDAALKADKAEMHVLDLAEEWNKLTQKPFVFAFWGIRKSSHWNDRNPFVVSFQEGMANLRLIVHEQAEKLGLPVSIVESYLNKNMNYTLDKENMEGLQLFFRMAQEHRLVSSLNELEFIA
jgi:chorismate dehydratase